MLRHLSIIFGCLALGELLVWITNISFPSSIIGMLFLVFFLKMKWIQLHWVKSTADSLLAHLGLFFVPPCIKMILYFDIIQQNFLSITISIIASTILVLITTGGIYQFIRKKQR